MLGSIHTAMGKAGSSLPGTMSRDCPSKGDKPTCEADFLISVKKRLFWSLPLGVRQGLLKKNSLPLGLSLLLFRGIEIGSFATEVLLVSLFGFGTDGAASAPKP